MDPIIIPILGISVGIIVPISVFIWQYFEVKDKNRTILEISKNIDDPAKIEDLLKMLDERKKEVVLWFLYPAFKAKMLTGTIININNLWINSLSIVMDKNPVERITKDGTNRQWIAQAKETVIAILSVRFWVFCMAYCNTVTKIFICNLYFPFK